MVGADNRGIHAGIRKNFPDTSMDTAIVSTDSSIYRCATKLRKSDTSYSEIKILGIAMSPGSSASVMLEKMSVPEIVFGSSDRRDLENENSAGSLEKGCNNSYIQERRYSKTRELSSNYSGIHPTESLHRLCERRDIRIRDEQQVH